MSATAPRSSSAAPLTAADLIEHLDAAGIKRALVLSTAYIFEQPSRKIDNAREKLVADNDWTAQQVAQFPDRLIGFCGVNPLKDYALDEIARCARNPYLRRGLKLHFGNAVVDYHNAQHIAQVQRVFRAANDHGMAIVVHTRASVTAKMRYGRDEALIFLNEMLPSAPDVAVQIAHLTGAGGYEMPAQDDALQVFIEAIGKGDARTRQLWFDVTTVVTAKTSPQQGALIAERIRAIDVQRVLYGSDAAVPGNSPRDGWKYFRALPLTGAEFEMIASNVPPYMRADKAFNALPAR